MAEEPSAKKRVSETSNRYSREQISETSGNSNLSVELERMKAQIQALDEVREAFNQRFSEMSERIGELRSMIIDHEKEAEVLRARAERAIDIVEETRPENLLKEVKKKDMKMEALESKMDADQALMDKIIEELKDIRQTVAHFRGIEGVQKLSEEVKSDLQNIRKIEAKIERHGDKVEVIYSEIQKRFAELERIKKDVAGSNEMIKDLLKKIDTLDIKLKGFVSKKELESVMAGLDKKAQELDELSRKLKNQESVFKDIASDSGIMSEVSERINQEMNKFDEIDMRLQKMENFMDTLKNLHTEITRMGNHIRGLDERTKGLTTESSYKILKNEIENKLNELENIKTELREKTQEEHQEVEKTISRIKKEEIEIKSVLELQGRINNLAKEIKQLEDNQNKIIGLIETVVGAG